MYHVVRSTNKLYPAKLIVLWTLEYWTVVVRLRIEENCVTGQILDKTLSSSN
jgi:hypothetical protein